MPSHPISSEPPKRVQQSAGDIVEHPGLLIRIDGEGRVNITVLVA